MPYYEVIVKVTKNFCVLAKDEGEAEQLALDETIGDGDNDSEVETVDDLDEKEDAEIIADYKREGKFLK